MIPRRPASILAFVGLYLAVQIFFIARGHFAASKHFGFWMFPESTFMKLHLVRVLPRGQRLPVPGGEWVVAREDGALVTYRWRDFVRGYHMDFLDQVVRSKGTVSDTLRYAAAAVAYVAARIPEDRTTEALELEVDYRRAGGTPEHATYTARVPRAR